MRTIAAPPIGNMAEMGHSPGGVGGRGLDESDGSVASHYDGAHSGGYGLAVAAMAPAAALRWALRLALDSLPVGLYRESACAFLSSRVRAPRPSAPTRPPPPPPLPPSVLAPPSEPRTIVARNVARTHPPPPPPRSRRSTSRPASASSSSSSGGGDDAGLCSSRGMAAPGLLPSYLTDARSADRYHPTERPDGALQLSVAENQMMEDVLVPAVRGYASPGGKGEGTGSGAGEGEVEGEGKGKGDVTDSFYGDMIYYQPTHGRESLRVATADYLRRVLRLDGHLDVDGLVLGAGCNAVLENLCVCLADRGDAVLIPTPYYAAFEFDLVARADLRIVPVRTVEHSGVDVDLAAGSTAPIPPEAYNPTRESLDAAYESAVSSGCTPRVLLLSHPNNPLGVCYPPSAVRECVDWCRERGVHVISDEIYAGSVFRGAIDSSGDRTFVSALNLAAGHERGGDADGGGGGGGGAGLGLGPYVHLVYALSKDFALSGLRVGAAYSENELIRLPMSKLNDLCQISSQTQLLAERMLSSPADGGRWSTDVFLPENRRRIRGRCARLERALDGAGVPYLRADSGLFVWIDLREFLPPLDDGAITPDGTESAESMERRERSLYLDLINEHGLLFTPGLSMRNELPGFFRCVYTAASDGEFHLALERIGRCVSVMRGER